MSQNLRILGIDPGSRLIGFGCIDIVNRKMVHVTSGTLKVANTHGKALLPLHDRLLLIYEGLNKIIKNYSPQVMAIEQVFFAKNAVSALKLGQARGVAILSGKVNGLEIAEYSANQVKSSISGYGHAGKEQVAKMVSLMTGQVNFETADASDGLALALCHGLNCLSGLKSVSNELLTASGARRDKNTTLSSVFQKKRSLSLAQSVGFAAQKKK